MKNTGSILFIGALFLVLMAGVIAFLNPLNPLVGLPTAIIGLAAFAIGLIYRRNEKEQRVEETDQLVLRDLEEEKAAVLLDDEDQYV